MGLAAPRNRTKIARDPRNLAWSANASTNSFGHRVMTAQGWSEGQSLGSKTSQHHSGGGKDENAARLAAARVGVIFKDDTLGIGAKLKSKDAEAQRTGMDAFMGLLGRLNAKNEEEEAEVEKKQEEKKLERYAAGRWGGMTFVPGGVLVGGEEFGTKKAAREAEAKKTKDLALGADSPAKPNEAQDGNDDDDETGDRARRKAEKRQRKEARRLRREAKAARKAERAARKSKSASTSQNTSDDDDDDDELDISTSTSRSESKTRKCGQKPAAPDEPVSSSSDAEDSEKEAMSRPTVKRKRSETSTPVPAQSPAASPRPTVLPRNGRHLLRGRNIEAKRRAFQDAKGLDGIFMKAAAA